MPLTIMWRQTATEMIIILSKFIEVKITAYPVFVSPMQSVLTPGKSIDKWFSCPCIIGLPAAYGTRRSDRVSKTTQLSSQLSNTPYQADSPKRHVPVIVEETKRTPSLALYKTMTTVTGQQ